MRLGNPRPQILAKCLAGLVASNVHVRGPAVPPPTHLLQDPVAILHDMDKPGLPMTSERKSLEHGVPLS